MITTMISHYPWLQLLHYLQVITRVRFLVHNLLDRLISQPNGALLKVKHKIFNNNDIL